MASELDAWFNKEIAHIVDNEPLVSIKLLQRHLEGDHLGSSSSFAWMTMHSCLDTTAILAERIASNSRHDFWHRCNATDILVTMSGAFGDLEIDSNLVKQMLLTETANDQERRETIRLAIHLLKSKDLWRLVRSQVQIAVARIGKEIGVSGIGDLNGKAKITAALHRVDAKLDEIISSENAKYNGSLPEAVDPSRE